LATFIDPGPVVPDKMNRGRPFRQGPAETHWLRGDEVSTAQRKLLVSNNVRQATRDCPREFGCLVERNGDLCKVSCCVDGAMVFVTCEHEGPCPYKHEVWERVLCACPVRREIYNRYRV
jgi:hypothetical protein